jgi:hypothetical protein
LEDAIIEQFRLQPSDVSVTRHRPEAFLIRFQNRRHCEDVYARGKFQYRGADVCVKPWRSLTGALAATLFYRVRIVLDGVPRHAWLPDIVERLVGRTCALQCIDTNLLHPTDTRGIELWAWTANPSSIPKVMWLTFTTGSMDGSSSSWQVSEAPPARWQRGIRHRVCVHLWEIHNYANVATDPNDPDVAISEPEKRRLPWFWGVQDGDPAPMPAFPPFQCPPPPRVVERRDERAEEDRRDRERRDRVEAELREREEADRRRYDDDQGGDACTPDAPPNLEVLPAHNPRLIPVSFVFHRLKRDLSSTPPSLQQVDDALTNLMEDLALLSKGNATSPLVALQGYSPTEELQPAPATPSAPATTGQAAQVCFSTAAAASPNSGPPFGVADLFVTPPQGLLQQQPPAFPKRGRRVNKPFTTAVSLRRSKRQAVSRLKHLSVEQRANVVLCRLLGYIKDDDLSLAEQAIQEFVASFNGPMPPSIVAGLTALFHLDDDEVCNATDSLIRMGATDVADPLPNA